MSDQDTNSQRASKGDRMPLAREISLKFKEFRGFITEFSSNISAGGMFIQTDEPKPPGSVFDFEFSLSDDFKLIEGIGEVVWVRDEAAGGDAPPGMGIRFLHIDRSSEELIEKMVEEHTRQGGVAFDLEAEKPAEELSAETAVAMPPAGSEAEPSVGEPSPLSGEPQAPTASLPRQAEGLPPLQSMAAMPSAPLGGTSSTVEQEGAADDLSQLPHIAAGADEAFGIAAEEKPWAPEPPPVVPPPAPEPVGGTPSMPVQPTLKPKVAPPTLEGKGPPVVPPPPARGPVPPPIAARAEIPELPVIEVTEVPQPRPVREVPEVDHYPTGEQRRSLLPIVALAAFAVLILTAAAYFMGWLPGSPRDLMLSPRAAEQASEGEAALPAPAMEAEADDDATVADLETVVEETVEVAVPPSEPLSPMTRLESIRFEPSAGVTELVLVTDGAVGVDRYDVYHLGGASPRELIKLYRVEEPFQPAVTTVGTAQVTQVRTGYHTGPGGNELHVVIDLAAPGVGITAVEARGRELLIRLGSS